MHKDEMEFRDLVRKPEKLFGFSFFYFLALLLGLGVLYLWNMNTVGANAIPPAPLMDSTAFVRDIPLRTPVQLPPVDVKKAGISSDSLIARGKEIFRGNCVSCHGEGGAGDGLSAATLNPKPRNFHSLSGWTNGSKVSQIYTTLEEGIVRNGMASYNYLPPLDRFALAHYVRTFATGQPIDSPEELMGLETRYRLSEGKNVSGQIPVKRALGLLLREHEKGAPAAVEAIRRIESDRGEGARLLRSHAADLARVLSACSEGGGLPASPDSFAAAVAAAPAAFGFRPSVARLTRAEWGELYDVLLAAVSSMQGGA